MTRAKTGSSPRALPAVFFDRDGVINISPGPGRYVESPEEFHLIPEFPQVLRIVLTLGYEAVVVTNQRGIALGRMSIESLNAIHGKMKDLLAREGLAFRDIQTCLSGDDSDSRRKPNPGMLLEAARKFGLDLSRSWMIGDSETDIEAGHRAGCRTIRICTEESETKATVRVRNLAELTEYVQTRLLPAEDFRNPKGE